MTRCYILGAGFSKPFGLPLASDLTRLIFDHAWPVGSFQANTGAEYKRYLRQLYPDFALRQNWPGFEKLLTFLDEWEQYRSVLQGRNPGNLVQDLSHFRSRLVKHLGYLLCELTAHCSEVQQKLIDNFVRHVMQNRSAIISFNWDLLLEIACHTMKIPISYDGVNKDGLQLVKPHGSLNLAEMSPQKWTEVKTTLNIHNLTIEQEDDESVVVRATDPTDAKNRIVTPFETALLVEPTVRKSYQSPWIQRQWRRALDLAIQADEIIVIGYSFPLSDFRPRILLQIACGIKKLPPKIQIVDLHPKAVVKRIKQFIKVEICSIEKSWIDWFQD